MNARSTRILGSVVAAVASTTLAVPMALAAGPDPGGGGGGGGGATTGSIYSDLVIALRDAKGAPVLQKYVVPETALSAASVEYCVQPVSYVAIPGVSSTTNPVDGRTAWVVPLQGALVTDTTVPDGFTGACDAQPQYAMFIKEVELERLNLARTSETVLADKLGDVTMKLRFADKIALESTGRISFDGVPIDASPENAAIYQSLLKTGTIPGLPSGMAGPPAVVGPTPADDQSNSQFGAWELAAMNLGAAASKSTPLTLDAIEYYNRIIGFPPTADYTSTWPGGPTFVTSADPDGTDSISPTERFIDYSGFTYNRSQTFKGSVTWLDVTTLKWVVSKITDRVPFTNLSSYPEIGTKTLTGITAFAQLADDVRAMCNFVPDNTFIPGFSMDVPGVDTTADQLKAIHDPAVDLGTLPENVFRTFQFQMTASLLNPWAGDLIDKAQLRLTVDAEAPFSDGDIAAVSGGQSVPFTVDANGDLVGTWGPDTGFPVAPGYNVSTTFDVTVAAGAPLGAYGVTLALVDLDDPTTVLTHETGMVTVNDNVATLLWGSPLPKYTTQGSSMPLPLQVYAPDAGTAELNLSVTGPTEDPATPESEALAAGDIKVFASNGTDMVAMPITLDAAGRLVGTWNATVAAGFTPVTWYATVIEGAPVGSYSFGASLTGGNTLAPISVVVFAPETNGQQPPASGDDTTAPVLTVTPDVVSGSTVTFTLTANESPVDFTCMLQLNGATGTLAACTSPVTYSSLAPGDYVFSAQATDKALNASQIVTRSWTVEPPDTTAPVITMDVVGTPGATAAFEFGSLEAGVTFECALTKDDVAGTPEKGCTSPKEYRDLAPGAYTFSVVGIDAVGNRSLPEVSDSWTVSAPDTRAPQVTVTPVGTPGTTATFTIIADEPAVTFRCQLTKNGRVSKAWAPCNESVTYTKLPPAAYVLSVQGTDAAGNASTISTRSWVVVKASRK